ncbi:type III-A CRISPR-associated RAMP protein Csm3 [Fervidobacterium nodosum]|uniref:CRISPR system Cms endoribonuclease Csm3 n=1 Tax=Fervidobacterium nodosum (strain ATCC 35602 / DSM 5306 / Rt17-B1) TaxID=381764 RepID=A7HMV3_FERNB|nr:type III-A CRISPR-associated RAMP protein Csm3 [Fervidobacterium nodosum]ABS61236.1 CRISPR-associated RAMP protein, Csm3 family [Fervidobacterium nodosum Rt17-B1]
MAVKSFKGKYIVKADIRLITGLHIGTSKDDLEIGGLDNPVIKDPEGKPYIPGSTLKGKLRVLSEFFNGKVDESGKPHACDDEKCVVCGLFGTGILRTESKTLYLRRLIVRDAYIDPESLKDLEEYLETKWTEVKHENMINRLTSRANPRPQERVPAGAVFKAEFVVNIFEGDNEDYLNELLKIMKLLEDDYIGGSGSRGYGKIKFENIKIIKREKDYYTGDKEERTIKEIKCLEDVAIKSSH